MYSVAVNLLLLKVTATHSCTRYAQMITFASSMAFILATTFSQLLTTLSNWGKFSPHNFPQTSLLPFLAQPHSSGHTNACPHMYPVIYVGSFICSIKAARVGGIQSYYDPCFLLKRSNHTSLIAANGLNLLYIAVTNISIKNHPGH